MKFNQDPYPVASFEHLAAAEASHWWFRARNRILLWVLCRYVGKFENFLEIGCGTGYVLEGVRQAYPHAILFGSEYFEEGLVHARRRIASATLTQIDARTMRESERYDVIGAFDVLEHIEEDEQVLANLSAALKPTGALLITVPQHLWLWSAVDEHACHVRRYTRKDLVDKVTRSGLQVEYVTSFVSCLVPLMWLARVRARSQSYDPIDEFQIPGLLNRALEWAMSLELSLLKRGWTFPVGGSLLILARKKP